MDNNIEDIGFLKDDDFFEVVSDYIYENGEDDFAQRFPEYYVRYLEIQDKLESDDSEEDPSLNFKDLYQNDNGPKISAPSFANIDAFLKMKPVRSILSNYSSPISEAFQTMRNGGFIGRYQNGGGVSPAYSRYMPVGNSKKIEGLVPVEGMIPIQTEVGELIVHPTMDITSVNAKKRHSQLGTNEVTDVVPEGSYVLSRHGVVRIYKDEADKVVVETQNKPYSLYTNNPQPKVKTLGDMMTKKEMAPAELASSILNKYKIVNHNDPFTDQTNKANKYNSSRYIKSIIELSEFDKARKGISNGEDMSNMFSQVPDQWSQNGGYNNRSHYQAGGTANTIKGIMQFLPAITSIAGSLFGNRASSKANEQARQLSEKYAKQYSDILSRSNQLGFLSNAAATLGQDPTVQVAKRDSSYLQGLLNRLGSTAERNAFMQDLVSSSPDLSKVDPRAAGALGSQLWANQLRSMSEFNTRQAAADRAAREKYTGMMSDTDFYNKQQDVQKSNQEQMNRNRLLTLLGSQAAGFAGSQGDIDVNTLNALTGSQRDYLQNEQKRKSELWSNLTRGAGLLGTPENMSFIQGLLNKDNQTNNQVGSQGSNTPSSWRAPMLPGTDPRAYSPSGSWASKTPVDNSWGGYRLNWP